MNSVALAEVGDDIIAAVGAHLIELTVGGTFNGIVASAGDDGSILAGIDDVISILCADDGSVVESVFDGGRHVADDDRA